MHRRWSDAQLTGRYLRRTIVHGKGEAKPKRKQTTGSQKDRCSPRVIWGILFLIVIGLIVLYFVSKALFCVAMVILILVIMAF